MKLYKLFFLLCLLVIICSCSQPTNFFTPGDPLIRYQGRISLSNPSEPILVGSASYIEVNFKGDSCTALLKNMNTPDMYGFISVEIDGKYQGRVKIAADSMVAYSFTPEKDKEIHNLKIFKATEAQNGNIAFGGIKAEGIEKLPPLPERKIEFIGNSITCGMGVGWEEIPCNTNHWYDQHNAYYSYATISAKELNAQFMLSSYSGIGIYRSWNLPKPIMPEVYEDLMFGTGENTPWDFSRFTPELVSICLGTNDFSDGDGINERQPFDSARYVNNYIGFLEAIYSHYPETQACLLTSPMVDGEKASLFEGCLTAVKKHFDEAAPEKKTIALYFFNGLTPHGCDNHPDKADQQEMAKRLTPFYKEVMGW